MARLMEFPAIGREYDAGKVIERRLQDRGPAPYSLCEARLIEDEFEWLTSWARQVAGPRLSDALGYAGLVLLTFIAEWNRRNSEGDTVWRGLAGLFGNESARSKLFTSSGDAQSFTRGLIEDTARKFHLRHAFDEAQYEAHRWYITIQLQYGFSRQQVDDHLAEWLHGQPVTDAMRRLQEPGGPYRSRSFQQLFDDLRYFRRDYLTQVDLRRTLETSPWVLPGWIDRISAVASRRIGPVESDAKQALEVVSLPRIEWDSERGPFAVCRVLGLEVLRLQAGRYHLRKDGQLLVSWFRQTDGTYLADRKEVQLPVERPEVVVNLEDAFGEHVFVQTIIFWSSSEEVQVLPLGRFIEPVRCLEGGRDYVLLARQEYRLSDAEVEWCLLGRGPHRRRWVIVEGAGSAPHLRIWDEAGNLVWQAQLAASVPQWAEALTIHLLPKQLHLHLEDDVSFELSPAPQVRVEYASCAGQPLEFLDQSRTRTQPIQLHPDVAWAGFPLRVGLNRNGDRAVLRRTVSVPTRGLAEHARSSWRSHQPERWLTVAQATVTPFRVFTDGPNSLMEGSVVHGRVSDRPRPLGRLLGTGRPIRLVDQPYNTQGDFSIASNAIDFGLVRSFDKDWRSPHRYRLQLMRPIVPTDQHEVVLWSSEKGVTCIKVEEMEVEQEGRVWLLARPWPSLHPSMSSNVSPLSPPARLESRVGAPEGLLCGLAYEGARLGFGWLGQWHRFFSNEPANHPTLSVRQHIALVRWFRLPGMLADKHDRRQPVLRRLANQYPVDLLAVALSVEGGEPLLGGLGLEMDDTASGRELFDAQTRELLFDLEFTDDLAKAIEGLRPADVPVRDWIARLFSNYPLLAARALRAGCFHSPRRPKARQQLRSWRLEFAGVPPADTDQQYFAARDDLLKSACGTLSEATIRIDEKFVQQGLVRPAVAATLDDRAFKDVERANLLVALGSAAFRQYLGLQLIDEIENRL